MGKSVTLHVSFHKMVLARTLCSIVEHKERW